jgi:HEAT repeat protein
MDADPKEEGPGFREFVKNPEWRRAMERAAEEEALRPPKKLDNAAIRAIVERFLQGTFDDDAKACLAKEGHRIVPIVLKALADSRIPSTRYQKGNWHATHDNSPLETFTDLLDPFGPLAAVPLLAPLVAHPDPSFRKYAAIALGNIGNDDCIEPLCIALADKDDYVRCFALMGIRRGISAKRATPRLLEAMFTQLVPLLSRNYPCPGRMRRWCFAWLSRLRRLLGLPTYSITHGGFSTHEETPKCLLEIDRDKAIGLLLDERVFSVRNEYLYRVLEALNETEAPIPFDKMRALLAELRPTIHEYFIASSVGELLQALARAGTPEARELIQDALHWGNERIQETATQALARLEGISDPTGHVLKRLEKRGFKRLTKVQKVFYCVWLLNTEVCNGGLAQYFVNSSGNLAHLTLKALRVLGACHTEAILEQAMKLFGVSGPAKNRNERHEQLAAVFADKESNLRALDDEFYKDQDGLATMLQNFARKYKRHFGARDR